MLILPGKNRFASYTSSERRSSLFKNKSLKWFLHDLSQQRGQEKSIPPYLLLLSPPSSLFPQLCSSCRSFTSCLHLSAPSPSLLYCLSSLFLIHAAGLFFWVLVKRAASSAHITSHQLLTSPLDQSLHIYHCHKPARQRARRNMNSSFMARLLLFFFFFFSPPSLPIDCGLRIGQTSLQIQRGE